MDSDVQDIDTDGRVGGEKQAVNIAELRWRFPLLEMVVGVMIEEGSTGLPLSLYTPFLDLNSSHMLLLNNVCEILSV